MFSINLKKYFLLFLLFVIVLLLLQVDDSLSEDAQKAVDANNGSGTSQAFLYLLGFGAALDEDPIEKGKEILAKIREREKTYDLADEVEPFNIDSGLKLPENELFCSITGNSKCLNSIFDTDNIDISNPVYSTLKKRYAEFLKLNDFQTLMTPHLREPSLSYNHIKLANKLALLESVKLAKQCCPEQAAENLYQLIDSLQKRSATLDHLIYKIINLILIDEMIETLSMLVREYNLSAKKINFLTKEQLSLSKAIDREFAMGMRTASTTKDKFLYDYKWKKWAPLWLKKMIIQAVFKENMTGNSVFKIYKAQSLVSESEQTDFEYQMEQSKKIDIEKAWLRNYLGTAISGVASPDFYQYIARGFDINAKIALFNGILGKEITPQLISNIQNPYYKDSDHKAYIDKEKNRVCFDGPMEDKRGFRCLALRQK